MLSKYGSRITLPIIEGVSDREASAEGTLDRGAMANDEYGDISNEIARAHLAVLFL